MKELITAMLDRLKAGERVVLCTVLASSGSSPRGAGARMAVFADGTTMGTVGGGAVELIATKQSQQALESGCSSMTAFNLSPSQINDIGMICGGAVTVYYQVFEPAQQESIHTLRYLKAMLEKEENAWLLLKLEQSRVTEFSVYTQDALPTDRRELFSARATLTTTEPAYYTEPISRRGRVFIFGGGHVGKALAAILPGLDFRVTVFDNRPELVKQENYPNVEIVLGDYKSIGLTLHPEDYAVVMTPGHQADYEVLLQVLPLGLSYVGCIGSRSKIARTNERLLQAGVRQEDIDRLHSPIGLPILAETPAEIAVSVAAELIMHRRQQRVTEC